MQGKEILLTIDQINDFGSGLKRPECVVAAASGAVYVANWDGGVTIIQPNGGQQHILASNPPVDLKPNGIALRPDGSFLLANLSEDGGVWHLLRDGTLAPFLTEIEGEAVPPANFVLVDGPDSAWITISTRQRPRGLAYRSDVADGFLIRVDARGARVVADGLGYTNECQIDPSGQWLYVNETFARRLSRFQLGESGQLGAREIVHEFGPGDFPDGLCFDEEGGAWITSIISNRLIRLAPDGSRQTMLEDVDPAHLAWVEEAYQAHAMGRPHLDQVASKRLRNISSFAFGGPDRRTGYLGCLLGENIYRFTTPVRGAKPLHWHWG